MSISVSLPDGSAKELPEGSSVFDLAKAISPRLAKAAVIGVVNEQPVDVALALPNRLREQLALLIGLGFTTALFVAWVTTR